MRVDLNGFQTAQNTDRARVTGPDGRAYARRSTRMKRNVCDELVAQGTPIVLEMYSTGQFDWVDGNDATMT